MAAEGKRTSARHDMIVMLLARGSCILLSLAHQSVLAKLLGPSGRGEYAVCLMVATLLSVGLLLGLDWALSHFVAAGTVSLGEGLGLGVVGPACILVVGSAIGLAVIQLPLRVFAQAPYSAFALTVFWVPFLALFATMTGVLRGAREFRCLSGCLVIRRVGLIGLTLLGVLLLRFGVHAPIAADMAVNALMALGVVLYLWRKRSLRLRLPSWASTRRLLHYGLRFFVGSLSMLVDARIGTLLLAFFAARDQIGQFAVAMALVGTLTSVASVAGQVIQPRVSSSERGRPELIGLCGRGLALFSIAALVGVLALARPIFALAFTADFYPAIPLLWILAPGTVVRCFTKPFVAFFNGTDRPGVVSLATFVTVGVNLGLLVLLLPLLGLPGAAWAASISSLAGGVLLAIYFVRATRLGLLSLVLPRRRDWSEARRYLRGARTPEAESSLERSIS